MSERHSAPSAPLWRAVMPLTLADIFVARRRLAGRVRRTPLVHSAWLSSTTGGDVYLKLESLQVTNSFKIRGAFNAALALVERMSGDGARRTPPTPPSPALPGLVTASAGNHGRALAYAAEQLGLRVTIFTPRDAPRAKTDAISRHAAELRAEAATYEEAERLAKAHAAGGDALFLSPYSDPDIIAGAGTIGIEIVEDLPEVGAIVVPVGGGGLASGMSIAVKSIAPRIHTIGVEAEASPVFTTSRRTGRLVEVDVKPTIADGLAGNPDPGTITFDLIQRYVDRLVLASDDEMIAAIRALVTFEHLIAEGAGSAAVAAVMAGRVDVRGRTVAVVVSGSNIDAERLAALLAGA